ncbi:SDR family NAD(P)-dependent oxidoreductase [Rhodoflexus sp.]
MFNAAPRVFITGASGLVGSYITRRLLREGMQVLALRRSDSGLLPERLDRLTWVDGDITDVPLLDELVANADWVIHAAALVSFNSAKRDALFKINVEGTANLVNACLQANVQRFCFISSVAALGGKGEVINERAQWDDAYNHSVYALSKHLAEREVWRGIAEGLPAFIVNPSVVLGKGKPDSPLAQLFRTVAKLPFYSSGMINLVDAADVAEGILRLLQHNTIAERFIFNAAGMSYRDFSVQVAAASGKSAPKSLIADHWLKAVGTVSGWMGGAFNRQTAEAACQKRYYDGSKLVQKVGLQYRPVADSIREAVSQTLNL